MIALFKSRRKANLTRFPERVFNPHLIPLTHKLTIRPTSRPVCGITLSSSLMCTFAQFRLDFSTASTPPLSLPLAPTSCHQHSAAVLCFVHLNVSKAGFPVATLSFYPAATKVMVEANPLYHKWKCLPLPCARVDHEHANGLITKICPESVKEAPCANVWCGPAETIQSFCTVSNLLLNKAEKNLHLKMLSCI